MTKTYAVKVEQRHREAAADLLTLDLGEPLSPADKFQIKEIRDGFNDEDAGVQAFARFEASLAARSAQVEVDWKPISTIPIGRYSLVGGDCEDGWMMLRVKHEQGHDPHTWCLGHDDCGDPVFATHWHPDTTGEPRYPATAPSSHREARLNGLVEQATLWLADYDDDRRDMELEADHAERFRDILSALAQTSGGEG